MQTAEEHLSLSEVFLVYLLLEFIFGCLTLIYPLAVLRNDLFTEQHIEFVGCNNQILDDLFHLLVFAFFEMKVNLGINIVQDKVSRLVIHSENQLCLGVISLAQYLFQILLLREVGQNQNGTFCLLKVSQSLL